MPGIFQRYAQEYPEGAGLAKKEDLLDWQWTQRQFEQLHLHRKQPDGLNIWTCKVTGPRKPRRLHGHLLNDASELMGEVDLNNPYLRLSDNSGTDDAL